MRAGRDCFLLFAWFFIYKYFVCRFVWCCWVCFMGDDESAIEFRKPLECKSLYSAKAGLFRTEYLFFSVLPTTMNIFTLIGFTFVYISTAVITHIYDDFLIPIFPCLHLDQRKSLLTNSSVAILSSVIPHWPSIRARKRVMVYPLDDLISTVSAAKLNTK